MKAIVAISQNWGIGLNNELLFSIPEDMKLFREVTKGKTIIMGRRTLESLPNSQPLKGRTNVVISTNKHYTAAGAIVVNSPKNAAMFAENLDEDDVVVIGGGIVYRAMLPYCHKIYVTKVMEKAKADSFFPNLDEMPEWKLTERSQMKTHEDLSYYFLVYERI